MISGLQGDFGDLDNKYLKQNIPKYLKMSVENIRKLQENTAAVHVWLGRRYQRIRICLTGEVETFSSPIRMSGAGYEMSADGIPPRVEWAML